MERFPLFARRMEEEGLPEIVIKNFEYYYNLLTGGKEGFISENEIRPVIELPEAKEIPEELRNVGENALNKTVLLKLNGGLGTSMGLDKAKSLLTVKNNMTFLDIIARHAISSGVPLVLMNSFYTREDSLRVLSNYSELNGTIPLDFLQHKVPKIKRSDLTPVTCPYYPELEWCPPGHGDIYVALMTSGMLDILIENGYEYVFVSNADNLGAFIDKTILGYFVENKLPFMMEVAERTEEDKKGGHLARLNNGQLILREIAQCPPDELSAFQDIKRYKYFNTNNLWINLLSLRELMRKRNNILRLSMICNCKTLDPRDEDSIPVYQLETAMGSAISVFKGSQAILVSKERFAPVKTTNELLSVSSDAYILTDDFTIIPNPKRTLSHMKINMEQKYYKFINRLNMRFPYGSPSLVDCESFCLEGDVKFGKDVILSGKVKIVNKSDGQIIIDDDSQIEGILYLNRRDEQ